MNPEPLSQLRDPHLGPDDLRSVLDSLVDVGEKWYYIGLWLNLNPGILNGINANQSNTLGRLCEMSQKWLKNSTSPTWKALVAALRSPIVDENQLANRLEQKHCSRTEPEVTEAVGDEPATATTPNPQTSGSFSSDETVAPKCQTSGSFSSDETVAPNPQTSRSFSSDEPATTTTPKCQMSNLSQSFSSDGPVTPKRQMSNLSPSFSSDGPVTPKRQMSNLSQSFSSDGPVTPKRQSFSSDGPVTPKRQMSNLSWSFSSDEPPTPTAPNRQISDSSQSYTSGVLPDISSDDSSPPKRQTSDSSQAKDDTDEAVKQKPLPKPYGCGCGNCSLVKYFEGNCPNPTETASKLPYLDTKGLSRREGNRLLARLERESDEMVYSFQSLVSSTYESLDKQNIPPSKLVTHLRSLGALEPTFTESGADQTPTTPLLRHRFRDMEKAETIEEVVWIIADYASFFNYSIIEHIIQKLGTSDDQKELQKYKEKLENYCKRRVVECPPVYGNLSDPDGVCVVVKLDNTLNSFTLHQLRLFESKLSTILHLSEYTPHLVAVEEGCLQLTYRIPASVKHMVFPLSQKQERALQQADVVQLSCGDYHFKFKKPFREAAPRSTGRPKTDCVNYKLRGDCQYGDRCYFLHERRAERVSRGYVPIPEHIPMRTVVGKVLPLRSKSYLAEPVSGRREIEVLADGEEQLVEGMEKVRVGISQLCRVSPTWTYFHPRGITENKLVQFREYTGHRPSNLRPQQTPYELYDCKANNQPLSEGYERPSHTLPLDSKAMLHETLDVTAVYRKEQEASIERAVKNITTSRKTRLMTDCRSQIKQRLHEALDWLQQNRKPNQRAKLEGRFGKLVWIRLPQRVLLPEAAMGLGEFEEFEFSDPDHSNIFNTDVRSEVTSGLDAKLEAEFTSDLETFDLKLTAEFADHGGKKLDVRLKVKDEKPEVVAIKWNDTKLATFDLLCLHRQHDTRLSLSYSEKIVPGAGPLFDIVQRLLENITIQSPQTLQLKPCTEQWNVHFIRHKKRRTYVTDGKYMVTKTIVGEYAVRKNIAKDTIITVRPEDYKEHVEVEFHNTVWECVFGLDCGDTPEESLAVYMDKPTVPPSVKALIPDRWDAETILEGVDEFLDKLDHLNEMLGET